LFKRLFETKYNKNKKNIFLSLMKQIITFEELLIFNYEKVFKSLQIVISEF